MTTQLSRTLSARDLIVITVGTVIGSGVFLTPGLVMRNAGSVGMAMAIWVTGGVLSMMGALTYAELGCMRVGAGGLYAYIRDAFGRATAFTYGWTLLLVIASGSVATLAVAAGDNLAAVTPLGDFGKKGVAFAIIGAVAALNVRGTRESTRVLGVATALKVLALAVLIVVLPVVGHGFAEVTTVWPTSVDGSVLSGGLVALVSVLWAYEGWQYATFMGGEVIDPQRNFPRGLVIGTLCIAVIYIFVNVGYLAALGPVRLASSTAAASESVGAVFGPVSARLIAIPVLVSIISALHGILLTSARVIHAMSRDGLFFAKLGEVHPKFGTPANGVIALAAWSAVLAMSGTFEMLLTYVVFVGWFFYGLGGASVIVFRRREPDAPRPMRVPGYPVTPILFVLSAMVIVVNTIVDNPMRGLIGVLATLSALPVYLYWRRAASRAASRAA